MLLPDATQTPSYLIVEQFDPIVLFSKVEQAYRSTTQSFSSESVVEQIPFSP